MRFSILAGLMAIQGSCQAAYLKRPSNEQVSRVTNTSTSVRDQLDSLADAALTAANLLAIKDAAANKTTCTKENMQVRKEWYVRCYLTTCCGFQRRDSHLERNLQIMWESKN